MICLVSRIKANGLCNLNAFECISAKHLQKPGALKVNAGQQQTQAAQQAAHRQPVSQQGTILQTHNALPPTNQVAKQQVQSVIHQPNHIGKQQFLHQQNQLLMKQPLPAAAQLRASPSVMSPIAQTQQSMRTVMVPDQIQLELHQLRKERERLIQEQEENKRKVRGFFRYLDMFLRTLGISWPSGNSRVSAHTGINLDEKGGVTPVSFPW